MSHTDGLGAPAPLKNIAAYRRMAKKAGKIWDAKVMKDPRLADLMGPQSIPFDAKYLIDDGFKILVVARAGDDRRR